MHLAKEKTQIPLKVSLFGQPCMYTGSSVKKTHLILLPRYSQIKDILVISTLCQKSCEPNNLKLVWI